MTREERLNAVSDFLQSNGRLRMSLSGQSMLPSIAAPMVLQIGPATKPRIGDVIVFHNGEVNVAHRVIGIDPGGFRTSGDNQPEVVESIWADQVVGQVIAIWSDPSPSARRIDDRFHRARGWYYGHLHAVRCFVHNAFSKAHDLIERARPQRRARMATRLVEGIAAARRNDADGLVESLRCNAGALASIDRRHRCSALLGEAARRLGVTDRLPPDVASRLRKARLSALLGTTQMERAVHRTVEVLRDARIEFALLKGAARVYGATPGAACHLSDDVDILVPLREADRAAAALQAQGWHYRDSEREVRRFREQHHHLAPLFSPDDDFPVEIHHELAQPGTLSLDTTWDALRWNLVPLAGSAGTVLQLDPLGTALHLAIHAVGFTRLRDVALLADLLPSLSTSDLHVLKQAVLAESRDHIRLAAAVALGARVAGIWWVERPEVTGYIRWALRREDLPGRLRLRSGAAEAYFARPYEPWTAMRELVPWWSRGTQILAVPGRVVGRSAANVLALTYAMRMRPSKAARIS
jgi:hypothetical protein